MDGALFAYSREPHVLAGDLIVSSVTFSSADLRLPFIHTVAIVVFPLS